jgi:hypothetical protein
VALGHRLVVHAQREGATIAEPAPAAPWARACRAERQPRRSAPEPGGAQL